MTRRPPTSLVAVNHPAPELTGPVEVVGAGLLGTSIALACRRAGLEVWLTDINPEHVRTATGLAAGAPRPEGARPQLVVVAVPPDHLGPEILAALNRSDAVITDVGSIKADPLRRVRFLPYGVSVSILDADAGDTEDAEVVEDDSPSD